MSVQTSTLTFERVIGEYDLRRRFLFNSTMHGFKGYCPRCCQGKLTVLNQSLSFQCSNCSASGGPVELLAIVRRIGIRAARDGARQLLSQEADVTQAEYFRGQGVLVRFRDSASARLFDRTVVLCERLRMSFDDGYEVLSERWLRRYLRCLDTGAIPPDPPSDLELEQWLQRFAIVRRDPPYFAG